MRKLAFMLAVIVSLVSFSGGAHAVGKITQDPNTGVKPADASEDGKQIDERLSRKITYFSGYTRLSDAVSEISRLSDIDIYVGRSVNDWQVRDMPVVVCANNIEVGKLLKLLTDAYFLWQSVTKVNGVNVYRLYRSKTLVKQLNEYAKAMDDYGTQLDATERRALCWVGTLDSDGLERLYEQTVKQNPQFGNYYGADGEGARAAFDEIVLYGKLVNTLSDKELSRRLSRGDTVVLSTGQGGDVGKLVRDYARLRTRTDKLFRVRYGLTDASDCITESDIDNASISFQMDPSESYPKNGSLKFGSSGQCWTAFGGSPLSLLLTLPRDTLPRVPGSPPSQNRDLKRISNSCEVDSEKKYDLQAPSDKEMLLADVITAISKATGNTIVSDDYVDQKADRASNLSACKTLFSERTSLLDMKRALSRFDWYIDSDSHRMILRDWSWCDNYCNLIPRVLFSSLLKKANGSGFELADLLAVWQLTDGQMLDWISGVKELDVLTLHSLHSLSGDKKALLKQLSCMSSQDQNLALSDGVPVTNLGIDQFTRILNRLLPNAELQDDVSQLILKLVRKDSQKGGEHTYSVEITGKETHIDFPLDVTFPLCPPSKQK